MRIKINLVAFLVLALGLSYLMAAQVLSVLQDRYKLFAIFPDAGGVFTNQEVTYRGVTVGQVGELEVVEQGVRIELLIRDGVKIPERDVEARVMFKSAVGEQFVDLLPGSDAAPYLAEGSTIPIEQTSIPVSTQDLLSTLEAVLRGVPPEALGGAIDSLGKGLTGRSEDISTLLESTADLADLFAKRAPEIQGILRSGTRVGSAFLRSRNDFAAAIDRLVPVSDSLKNSTRDLARLLRGSNLMSEEVVALLREDGKAVNDAIVRLAEFNAIQAAHSSDLARLLTHLPKSIDGVVKSFEPDTGLIRFGLILEPTGQSCGYGTERRSPVQRARKLPPKNARCGGRSLLGRPDPAGSIDVPEPIAAVPPIPQSPNVSELPPRMSSWSWTLPFLRGF